MCFENNLITLQVPLKSAVALKDETLRTTYNWINYTVGNTYTSFNTLVPNSIIFSQYSRLIFSAVHRLRIWRVAFHLRVLIFHKTAADNMSLHEWENFCWVGPTCKELNFARFVSLNEIFRTTLAIIKESYRKTILAHIGQESHTTSNTGSEYTLRGNLPRLRLITNLLNFEGCSISVFEKRLWEGALDERFLPTDACESTIVTPPEMLFWIRYQKSPKTWRTRDQLQPRPLYVRPR